MTRVSSFGQTQSLLNSLLRNQSRVFNDQMQLNTGKKTQEFRGLAGDGADAMSARSFRARTQSFMDTTTTVRRQIEANDVQLNGVLDMSRSFRQNMLTTIGADEAIAFEDVLRETFNFAASSLNTQIGGDFIFAGANTDVPAVSGTDISDLVAAGAATDLFANDNRPAKAFISENVDVEYGVLASELATPLFESLKRIADYHFDGATGPIDGKLTAAQRSFLESEMLLLDDAVSQMQSVQTKNGLLSGRLDTVQGQHVDAELFLEELVSDIEDVNIAETIMRLNNDRTALEASLRNMSSLTNLSLLDFI